MPQITAEIHEAPKVKARSTMRTRETLDAQPPPSTHGAAVIGRRVGHWLAERQAIMEQIDVADQTIADAGARVGAARTDAEDAAAHGTDPAPARAIAKAAHTDRDSAFSLRAGLVRRLAVINGEAAVIADDAATDLAEAAAPMLAELDAEYAEARAVVLGIAGRFAAMTQALKAAETDRFTPAPPTPALAMIALPPSLMASERLEDAYLRGQGAAHGWVATATPETEQVDVVAGLVRRVISAERAANA